VVQQEIKWALDILAQMPEETIYLIPVRLEVCQVPEQMSELHWVDLFEPDGFEYLTRALDFEINQRQPKSELEPKSSISSPPEKLEPKPTRLPKIIAPDHPFEPELIFIPAGEFLMGSDPDLDKNAQKDEQPMHRLNLPDYYIAKTPVTNAQYAAFVEATGHRQPRHWENGDIPDGMADHPVVKISWYDAVTYCHWLAQETGKPYRLPTEAEWEKAARGRDGQIYTWGNDWDDKRCNTWEGGLKGTTPVGAYPTGASPYGVLDMAGNVWEWVQSEFRDYPYQADDGRENLNSTNVRVLRGGSWTNNQYGARCVSRDRFGDDLRIFGSCGCRVAVSPI
jgi:formylglycine-generating enzyme required for sulfatase activity